MIDEEIECAGCGDLVDVSRPLGVEVSISETPTLTGRPGARTIRVGGVRVHVCDPAEVKAEQIARRVGELLRSERETSFE
jgi:hypothetical protein